MNCFLSPLLTVVAKNVAFFAGSLLAVLIALTIYDEDVLAVEHVLSSITLLGVCITVCRSGLSSGCCSVTFIFISIEQGLHLKLS